MAKAWAKETVHGGEKRRRSIVRRMEGIAWNDRSAVKGSWAQVGITKSLSMMRRDQ